MAANTAHFSVTVSGIKITPSWLIGAKESIPFRTK